MSGDWNSAQMEHREVQSAGARISTGSGVRTAMSRNAHLTALMIAGSLVSYLPNAVCQPISNNSKIAAGNTATRVRAGEWEWTTYVMGDDATLARISCVKYLLHPTFVPREKQVCTKTAN